MKNLLSIFLVGFLTLTACKKQPRQQPSVKLNPDIPLGTVIDLSDTPVVVMIKIGSKPSYRYVFLDNGLCVHTSVEYNINDTLKLAR